MGFLRRVFGQTGHAEGAEITPTQSTDEVEPSPEPAAPEPIETVSCGDAHERNRRSEARAR